MIASFGMALRYSFDMGELAEVDAAIAAVLPAAFVPQISSPGHEAVNRADGRGDLKELQALHGWYNTLSVVHLKQDYKHNRSRLRESRHTAILK
jgi:hypothetical protein